MLCGIDPGTTGAIAWLSDAGELIRVEDLPMVDVVVSKKMRKQLAGAALARLLADERPSHVFIEHVGTRPGEGAVGAFSFGRGFGTIEGILDGLSIGRTLVRPDVWKRSLRVQKDKGQARQRAMQCFPAHAASFARVKDDGRAEAALIGAWGAQSMQVGRPA